MAWTGKASKEEMLAVYRAIHKLYYAEYIDSMSYKQIASACGLKETAVRWIVPELMKHGYIMRMGVGEGKVPRYFYVPQPEGEAFMFENGGTE